ncbi:histidine kinase [Pseudomonas sp. PA15(2017)]|uniref:sensor histidine kinase n=1 Tax=Pseudomonas sp. PA15(2017) TaxID=1932111 RepID=UPI00095F6E8B|nr:sensor histidine kinase KdpD [Pseudomonas sp. PA15(2017)]OLU29066.1 histidine kinase [Pseudomonas sp. PA15(2017)]
MNSTQRADALLADLPRDDRGRLKIFLGAAPGVGKTYAMLQAARRQQELGVDVRCGIVETHGRSETAALTVGLRQQEPRAVPYRGMTLAELDLDALLAARPALALVDELAHSNAPGSRHTKRWQDVQELLAAGIDVYSTINVQHLESLNDQVHGITGIRVRETVPDWVIQEADEILLIDLPPRDLLERLREGKVYVPEQARAAIDAYFSQTNLTALRELAMQTAAARVDADLDRRALQHGEALPAVRGRLLVGIQGDECAQALVRHASRLAQRRQLPWTVVHVDAGRPVDDRWRQRLQAACQLAERLGGEVVTLRGEPARSLIEHAHDRRASSILIARGEPRAFWRRNLAARLLALGAGLEISVLDIASKTRDEHRHTPPQLAWKAYALAALVSVAATLVAMGLTHFLELPNVALVFLSAVLVVAVRSSIGPALTCAVLSFVAYNWFFIEPLYSLTIDRHQDVLSLFFFLFMAALTGNLASHQRRQLQSLRETQGSTVALLELSRSLAKATDRQAVINAAVTHLQGRLAMDFLIIGRGEHQQWLTEAGVQAELGERDEAAADWAWRHMEPAGLGTDTLPDCAWWWFPLTDEDGPLAVLGARPRGAGAITAAQRRALTALTQPIAQSLARTRLAENLEAARLHGETEQLRSALLASVSHDLRTPLTAMRGSIDSLLSLGSVIPPAERIELLEGTRDEAERLDRYIQNLLDMTRLGHGGMKLSRDWVAPGDIVSSAVNRLRHVLSDLQLSVQVPPELPLLHVHAALIEQALVNVLENAARFSPEGGRVTVSVAHDERELVFRVTDQGPGIPAAEREQIFDMFYTAARGDRGGKGTGLGLAICRGMLGAHGGRVEVADGDDRRGTALSLHLPLARHAEMAGGADE